MVQWLYQHPNVLDVLSLLPFVPSILLADREAQVVKHHNGPVVRDVWKCWKD